MFKEGQSSLAKSFLFCIASLLLSQIPVAILGKTQLRRNTKILNVN